MSQQTPGSTTTQAPQRDAFENLSQENRKFAPSPEFAANAVRLTLRNGVLTYSGGDKVLDVAGRVMLRMPAPTRRSVFLSPPPPTMIGMSSIGAECWLTPPTPMLPEILRRILSYPLLQNFTVPGDHRIDVLLAITRLLCLDRLEHNPEAAIRQPKHVHKAD